MIGKKVSHYSVTAKLGEGGMGEVYRATDTKLGRDVALKVLPEAFASDADRMARFEREAQVLASLNHPNIASIYGLEEADGVRCLVLELVEGPTLAERVEKGPVPLEEALPIARQMTEALEAAHERGVIHRDLKPGNVKVTPEGTVKVLDFGLAKAFQGEETEEDVAKSPTMTAMATQAGIILGTAAYMSPEQAKGKPVDRRADIWAFGIVLFEMLTGKQVFRGETVSETLAAVMMKDIGWGLLPADTPPPIHRLLRRCLDKDPKRRLRDIGEARVALEGYLADPSTSTVVLESGDIAATAAAAAPQPAWRRALPWVLVAAMALVAVLTVWSPWRQVRVRPSPVRLDVNVSGDEPIFVNRGASAVLSPDGSRLVFVAGTGQERKLYLRALDQLEATPLSGTEGASDPFFSPNGQWVAFFAGGKLKKVSVQGGAPVTLCDAVQARGGTWGPDDTIVFAPSNLGGLSRVSAAGGEPEPLTVLDTSKNERSHRWPFFLPNGKAVLFFAQIPGDSYIEAVVLETGEQKLVHRGGTYPRFLPTGHLLFVREGTMFATPFDPVRLEVTGQPAPVVDGVLTNPSGGGSQYAFSQTGTLVYLSGTQAGARTSVVWVDRKGALKPLVADKADYEDLRLSPDGKRLAVELNMPAAQDIVWVYDIERGTMSRLTFSAGGSYNPVWTPDGQRLAYASDTSSERGTRPNLFWKRADGVGEAERLTTSKNVQLASSWSPDGQVLLFNEQDPTNSWDIRALRVGENTEPETFLSTPFIEENAVFSPDGQWLAYESNESGEFQVYVRPFSGAGGKWQISTEGGLDARWSADGRELFYRSGDKVMVVSVSAQGESVRAGKPRQLFSATLDNPPGPSQAWDVALGGQRFVMLQPDTQEAVGHTHLNFILNWFDEVRQRVPTNGN